MHRNRWTSAGFGAITWNKLLYTGVVLHISKLATLKYLTFPRLLRHSHLIFFMRCFHTFYSQLQIHWNIYPIGNWELQSLLLIRIGQKISATVSLFKSIINFWKRRQFFILLTENRKVQSTCECVLLVTHHR